MQPNTYTIDVRVKPYVRQYLINNCGSPVDLSHLPKLKRAFQKLITRPLLRFESLPIPAGECYVSIVISEDTFYRHGWEISRTGMMDFNSAVEQEIKFVMRNYVASFSVFKPIATCIRMFQDKFNFPEEVWTFDAIKKDIDRNTEVKRSPEIETFVRMMNVRLNKLFVDNLSAAGTISKKYKNELSKI